MQHELAQCLMTRTSPPKGEEQEVPQLHSRLFKDQNNTPMNEPCLAPEHSSSLVRTRCMCQESIRDFLVPEQPQVRYYLKSKTTWGKK